MADVVAPPADIGRIVFRSWEHEWLTGDPEVPSIAAARRVLPEHVTAPIYEILRRWERMLLRCSLPYPPYAARIRLADNEWLHLPGTDYLLLESAKRFLPFNEFCTDWNAALASLPKPSTKYGKSPMAPSSDAKINAHYELLWRPMTYPASIEIDTLLGKFSPRYKAPSPFAAI